MNERHCGLGKVEGLHIKERKCDMGKELDMANEVESEDRKMKDEKRKKEAKM